MSPAMQKKFLRVLQEGEVRPLGSSRTVAVDVRLLSASHRDLEAMVRSGEFREDLYYRVNVLTVSLPPLRDRREDIPLLAEALLARAARETGREIPVIPQETLAVLIDHDWPGNVRELENEMRRLIVLTEGVVEPAHLSATIRATNRTGASPGAASGAGVASGESTAEVRLEPGGDLREAVASFERDAIQSALQRHGGNKSRAAAELGISRFALQRKLDKYELRDGDAEG